ncbi:unnamed protein product [Staurois parvus]|uniref:Uncharacterized protein n=1 Tax=Staurois parvus TaxID=386267 RepID=A0ABN9B3S9_9NEOB|nr:unnamed protein product [Staurois parvus]
MTAGTGSNSGSSGWTAGIGSPGHLARQRGTASSGKARAPRHLARQWGSESNRHDSGHRVTRHWIAWLDSGHRVTRHQVIWLASGHRVIWQGSGHRVTQVRQRALSQLAR